MGLSDQVLLTSETTVQTTMDSFVHGQKQRKTNEGLRNGWTDDGWIDEWMDGEDEQNCGQGG